MKKITENLSVLNKEKNFLVHDNSFFASKQQKLGIDLTVISNCEDFSVQNI